MRHPVAAAALVGLGLLAGCHSPGRGVAQTVVVEFVTADSTAAQPVVIAACGHLPGVTVDATAAGDPNVLLDYSHASTRQFEALTACVTNLQVTQPRLQIRDYRLDDGTDT